VTVEQQEVIDVIHLDLSGNVVLTISDHLPWDAINEHLFALQEKLNRYLSFIESGEIYKKFPSAPGRAITIDIVQKYAAPPSVASFFAEATTAIEAAGFRLTTRLLKEEY
jgi:hypothetical protein